MPEKVKLKNGKGEFVYPVIDPNDAGGGSGGRALSLFVTEDGGVQNIECYDMKNTIESHGEMVPASVTAEEFCQAFTLGGSIDLFVDLIHDDGQDYQTEGSFVSRWTSGDEKNSESLISSIKNQNVEDIATHIGDIAWPGIFHYVSDGTKYAVPANCYINMDVDNTGVVSFLGVYVTANSVCASDAKPYNFDLALGDLLEPGDLSLYWSDRNGRYALCRNTINTLKDSVSVDPFWGWYMDGDGLIEDLFETGVNTIFTSVDNGETQMAFKFVGIDQDDHSRYLFNGINCNKTLILTEAETNEADDPRGQGWVYPYISSYEIKDNGGSGGDSDVVWTQVPIYNYIYNGSNYSADKSAEIASIWIPYHSTTGMCVYDNWEDLINETSDVNSQFVWYGGDETGGYDADVAYTGPDTFVDWQGEIPYNSNHLRVSGISNAQIDSITLVPINSMPITQLLSYIEHNYNTVVIAPAAGEVILK